MEMSAKAPEGLVEDMRAKAPAAAEFIRKLGNPNRLMILCALAEGEKSVGELEARLDVRQPVLSQQLAELREAGMIVGTRAAKQVHYRLKDARARAFVEFAHRLFCSEALALEPAARAERPQRAQSQAAVFARAPVHRGRPQG